jgi:hypothetical protein
MRKMVAFYSWQSDRHIKVCKEFIRTALDIAAKQLNAATDLDVDVQVDADTQGDVGTSPVSQTVLDKIDSCDVFVG